MRVLFFASRPGIQIGLGDKPIDRLLFKGSEKLDNVQCLHFTRSIEPSDDNDGEFLNRGFEEDVWFARGKGLVRLEQRIDEDLTMVWNLVAFNPGIIKEN